ncbi:MAG: bifunctional GTP diphosphokinase/guanosine-3',5'-bis pyrophosphate 3'-pyrophosphohydrolase [Pseudomonadales bacterium]|nr:bifunctional GTP diphosphokinase/guanosine-3',5'-bis pyrophosphate 3'-pyrophosphohydrolase [Pseudomonadales bacterium]
MTAGVELKRVEEIDHAGLDALSLRLDAYLSREQIELIRQAYFLAEKAHHGQFRRNGAPYITHPLAVAGILCGMHMDHQSIMAAMLHDVIEDTQITKAELAKAFGDDVARLVDGVTKLTQVQFGSKAEAKAENFRKMMLAMTQDIRVILVKLADRLHNMRTLDVLSAEKSRRIAEETLEIYAPIANRLGMNELRMEYEDLGFAVLYPMRANLIAKAVKSARGNRKEMLNSIRESLEQRLSGEGLQVRVMGREKHLFSIYTKMREKRKSFAEIMDVYGFRIVTDTVDSCYRTLGVIHNLYKPVPGKFKDYIAIPKANGYQSLHTILIGQRGVPIEIQVRTEAMEAMANNGIAAHWLYKSEGFTNTSQSRAREWIKSLLEIQQNAGNSMEFIEHVKIDLFPDEVYVFTPKGRILTLAQGATAVDFAYTVHSDIGNTCVAARIDNRLAPLSIPLQSGQTVEIITAPGARPNPAWLNFVVTSKARANIRHFLKDQQASEAVDLGRRLLERALSPSGSSIQLLDPGRLHTVLGELNAVDLEQLLQEIGLGNRLAPLVAHRLTGISTNEDSSRSGSHARSSIAIRGTEGMVLTYARCCRPIPGDEIVGHMSSGKGLVVHRDNCRNIAAELRENPDKCLPLSWSERVDREFQVDLRVDLENQRGLLAVLATHITEADANIESIALHEKDSHQSVVNLSVVVHDRVHLARVLRRMRIIKGVIRVTRVRA